MISADSLINIEEGKTYDNDNIYALHCLSTNTEPVFLISPGLKNDPVIIPEGSFIQGAIYPIKILKIIKLGGANFLGYIKKDNG